MKNTPPSALSPYLFFNGNCRTAMTMYRDLLGGNLEIMTYGQGPEPQSDQECPGGMMVKDTNRIMHASLIRDDLMILASDTPNEEMKAEGNQVYLALTCKTESEFDTVFKKLSTGGQVLQEPHDAFWGARFAMLTDSFGISWMLSLETKKN